MTKLFKTLSVMIIIATAGLAGCDLYFGDHDGSTDQWNYCGSDGYYTCSGDDCTWVAPTCPTDSGSGAECTTNNDCAAGCYCGSGTCTEAGFCGSDADCGSGYTCDVTRSTCEPGTPVPTCGSDADCAQGSVCDTSTSTCDATCTCQDDTDATDAGYGWCDTTRDTCETGSDPAGLCAGTLTCATAAPACPDNQVPLILNGCWSGQCRAIAQCEAAPSCAQLEHEDDCTSRSTDCTPVYTGEDCTKADGTACHSGDTGCTCETFEFAECIAKSAPM
jgi:hypothetical protein